MNETNTLQYSTFYIADRLYGIDVIQVQEVAKALAITPIHLAPPYVMGLINLRGQIATAIGLRELFNLPANPDSERMSVVCKYEGALVSLLVDRVGDVIEVSNSDFENPPEILNVAVRKFMKGIYKTPESILSVLELSKLVNFLTPTK